MQNYPFIFYYTTKEQYIFSEPATFFILRAEKMVPLYSTAFNLRLPAQGISV